MRRPVLSPETYRRVTLAALVLLVFIVVTGAAVRLTGSGLGCTDWPTCEDNRVVAPLEYHAMVEFVNRCVTGLVSVAVTLAVLGSLVRRPRRRDLIWLSLGLVGGVVAQILLGGLVVLSHLWPPFVMGHFIVSMALLADAVVLHHRAGLADPPPDARPVDPRLRRLSRALVAAAGVVIVLGTVVTGAGPHSGENEGEFIERLPVAVHDAAQWHGASALAFLGLLLWGLRVLHRAGPSQVLRRRAEALLTVTVLQGAVGYTQYFTDVPPLLVALHVLGACLLWVATLWFHLGLSAGTPDPRESGHDRAGDRADDGAGRDLVTLR